MAKIAILYPSDPAGNAPSGIDSVIRGILKWAPPDLEYTLLGATTDPVARPVGIEVGVKLGQREVRFYRWSQWTPEPAAVGYRKSSATCGR